MPAQPPNTTVEVVLTVRWRLPRSAALLWSSFINERWANKITRDSAAAILNSVVNAPQGIQPELSLEVKEPAHE